MKTNNPLGSPYCQKALGTGLYYSTPNFSPALYYCVPSHTAVLHRKLPLASKISPGSHRLGGHSLEWYMPTNKKVSKHFLGKFKTFLLLKSTFRKPLISESHFHQKTGWVPLVSLSFVDSANVSVETFEFYHLLPSLSSIDILRKITLNGHFSKLSVLFPAILSHALAYIYFSYFIIITIIIMNAGYYFCAYSLSSVGNYKSVKSSQPISKSSLSRKKSPVIIIIVLCLLEGAVVACFPRGSP